MSTDLDGGRILPTYRTAQVRAAEAQLLESGAPLMRRAARALATAVERHLGEGARVLVIAGSGDNGGDALFAAAHLAGRAEVSLLPVSERYHVEGFTEAAAAGARTVDLVGACAADYDLIVDGIIGIGASKNPSLRGTAREAVTALLPRVCDGRSRVIAVDLPSGLHPDTGAADDAVLPAMTTVTFGAVKQGLAVGRGPELAGRVVLARIGLEEQLSRIVPEGEAMVWDLIDASR